MESKLGIPFELVECDIDRGETRTPEFLARNPNGRIPLLELEDGRRHGGGPGGCDAEVFTIRAPRGRAARPAV